jgi:hypothetical protein
VDRLRGRIQPRIPAISAANDNAQIAFKFGPSSHGAFGVDDLGRCANGTWKVLWADLMAILLPRRLSRRCNRAASSRPLIAPSATLDRHEHGNELMDFQPLDPSGGGFDFVTSLMLLFGLVGTVSWMVVGWRAMWAHESLTRSTEASADRRGRSDGAAKPAKPAKATERTLLGC